MSGALVRRRKRDIYGNWVWEDDAEIQASGDNTSVDNTSRRMPEARKEKTERENEEISLDWRDFVALTIASLETFLLPIVVFILILVGIVIGSSLFR